jgi:hypothetical protein
MEAQVRRLNGEYGFNLSEDEIKLAARQAEEAERLFQTLNQLDLTHIMPILKVDNEKVKK